MIRWEGVQNTNVQNPMFKILIKSKYQQTISKYQQAPMTPFQNTKGENLYDQLSNSPFKIPTDPIKISTDPMIMFKIPIPQIHHFRIPTALTGARLSESTTGTWRAFELGASEEITPSL